MSYQLNISIAGFSIQLNSERKLTLDIGFKHFITNESGNADIVVECKIKDKNISFDNAEKVFTSENEELKFYEIYRKGEDLLFVVYNQQNQSKIQQIALLKADLRHWVIWSDEINGTLEPLLYPMAPILLHYAILNADAVMMHASGVFDGVKGRMFSGFSGTGKSTISGIWRDAGNLLINDDRLIIRRENGMYFIYNTPMFYEDKNKKAPLDAVYLIRHSPENSIQKISGAAAVTGIMAFSIQNNYDKRFIQHHLDFFSKMIESVPIYRLGFVPDEGVIEFIKIMEE
ncbi:MAG: hypothetical protein GX102_14000 [Porphyromonadaceae bacterium]|nr:hypothetical protein [Porphyromonadaceae bacterium]